MARTDPQVNFRIPADLKQAIEESAATSNRTVTAEIVARLQQTFAEKVSVGRASAAPPDVEKLRRDYYRAFMRHIDTQSELGALRGELQDVASEHALLKEKPATPDELAEPLHRMQDLKLRVDGLRRAAEQTKAELDRVRADLEAVDPDYFLL